METTDFPPDRDSFPACGQSEFAGLNLPEPVLAGIADAGFSRMTPIQRQALPQLLAGSDLCGQAQTGTGKTATFLITLFTKLLDQANPQRRHPLGLILAPTRELAQQIHGEASLLGAHTGLRMAVIYGGEGFHRQETQLRAGTDIVVGTPGRLLDFARRRILDVSRIRFLVIDESDRLLDMGFWDELRDILDRLPPAKNRQSMLFSATLDHRTKEIASSYMNRPIDVAVKPEQVHAEGIEQKVYHVDRSMKFRLLLGIFSREEVPKGLIFANQKVTVSWLTQKLNQHGYPADMLTGDLPQKERNRVLEQFKNDETRLLVASDVASRGLHIEDVTHIINYDVPQDPEDYVHRIGRTARAGKEGKAYTLACDEYCDALPEVEYLLGKKIPFEIPYDKDYGEDRTPRFTIRQMLRQEGGKEGGKGLGPRPTDRKPSRDRPAAPGRSHATGARPPARSQRPPASSSRAPASSHRPAAGSSRHPQSSSGASPGSSQTPAGSSRPPQSSHRPPTGGSRPAAGSSGAPMSNPRPAVSSPGAPAGISGTTTGVSGAPASSSGAMENGGWTGQPLPPSNTLPTTPPPPRPFTRSLRRKKLRRSF